MQLRVHEGYCWSVAWNRNGSFIASCGVDRKINLVDTIVQRKFSEYESRSPSEIHSRTIRRVAWRPDMKVLAAVSFDSTISLWRVSEGNRLGFLTKLSGQENEVKGVSFSPCGELLATCSRDKSIWIFDVSVLLDSAGEVSPEEVECVAVLAGHAQDVKSVKFHPSDSHMLVSVSYDDTVKIWRSRESEEWELSETLRGHTGTVWDVAFEPHNGCEFATVSADGSMKIWTSSRLQRSLIPAGSAYLMSSFLRASACHRSHAIEPVSQGWSCQTIQITSSRLEGVPPPPVYAVDWSVSDLIAVACGDNTVRFFLRKGFNTISVKTVKMQAEPNSVSFSPVNGTDLAVGLEDGTVCVLSFSDQDIFSY